jgi:small subunit ribosomal protein S4
MARYTGSKTKLSKRVGRNLFLKGARSYSAKDDYARSLTKSVRGKGKRPSRVSEYGKQLLEKQALRFTYGVMEKQMGNIFKKAFSQTGDTGKIALTTLERRLDNVVFKAGMANSRSQARQLVNHGHFSVNGVPTDIPSYTVKVGDEVTIKGNKVKKAFWENFKLEVPNDVPAWLDTSKKRVIKVINLPLETDLPQDFRIESIVEYYSRKVA